MGDVLRRKPRALLVEKPLALGGGDALRLLRMADRAGVPLLVDLPRREHPAVQQVARLLASGRLGEVRRVTGTYSGGARHNGVHLLDVLALWYPEVRSVRAVCRSRATTHLELVGPDGRVPLILSDAAQPGCYVWELRVETERGRIDLGGAPETLRVFRAGHHPLFRGFTTLVDERAWSMDDEPLLARVVARLAALARSPKAAEAHAAVERSRHRFFNMVFAHLPDSQEHAS